MADVNKTIEITMKANLKQLQQSLENIPNMTKKEAQAMTRALSSEFNKAQKAAKKAAEESKKAAKATSAAYEQSSKKVGASFDHASQKASAAADEIKVSFEDAAHSTGMLEEGAEAIGTSMGAATLAVDKLIPGLDEGAKQALDMADGLATAAEQAIKGGPVTMALTVAVVAGAAAYDLYNKSSQLAAAQQKRLAAAQKEVNDKLNEQFGIVKGITADFNSINREYKVLTGQMTQLEFDLSSARDSSAAKTNQELDIQKQRVQEQERLLTIIDKGRKSTTLLSAEEKEILNTAMSTSKFRETSLGLIGSEITDQAKLIGFRTEALQRLQREKDFSDAILKRRKQTLKAEEQLIRAKSEYASEQKAEEDRLKKLAERDARRLVNQQRLKEIQTVGTELANQRVEAEDRANQSIIATLAPTEKIIAQTLLRLDHNKDLQEQVETQIQSAENLAKTDADREAAAAVRLEGEKTIATLKAESLQIETEGEFLLDELKQQNSDKEKDRIQKTKDAKLQAIRDEANAIGQMGDLTMGIFKNTVSTIGDMAKTMGIENAHLIRSLFEMQRVAAIGEIAFNVAKNLTLASGYLPPLNGLMAAGAIAAGAAQTASVLAQSPPEFHMGGMTPDETIAVVKSGEAVLDRATVNNLGGQQGVNRLQNGQTGGSPEVIVMNPYKHFDRFVTDRSRAGISSRSARRGY